MYREIHAGAGKAAITFLKWLTEAERNTRFAVSAGYMPVTQEAFDRYLPQEIENLTEQKYRELYKAFQQTQRDYQFYSAPQLGSYLETENAFEDQIRALPEKPAGEISGVSGSGG